MLFDAPMSVRFKGASHILIGKMQDDNAKMHHLFGLYKDSKKICAYFHCTHPLEIPRQISCFTHGRKIIQRRVHLEIPRQISCFTHSKRGIDGYEKKRCNTSKSCF